MRAVQLLAVACGQGDLQGLASPFPSARAENNLYVEGRALGAWERGRRALFAWVPISTVLMPAPPPFVPDGHLLVRVHGVPNLGTQTVSRQFLFASDHEHEERALLKLETK